MQSFVKYESATPRRLAVFTPKPCSPASNGVCGTSTRTRPFWKLKGASARRPPDGTLARRRFMSTRERRKRMSHSGLVDDRGCEPSGAKWPGHMAVKEDWGQSSRPICHQLRWEGESGLWCTPQTSNQGMILFLENYTSCGCLPEACTRSNSLVCLYKFVGYLWS